MHTQVGLLAILANHCANPRLKAEGKPVSAVLFSSVAFLASHNVFSCAPGVFISLNVL